MGSNQAGILSLFVAFPSVIVWLLQVTEKRRTFGGREVTYEELKRLEVRKLEGRVTCARDKHKVVQTT